MDIEEINNFLISKFLELSNVDTNGFIENDPYLLGKYDAFDEISDFINKKEE